MGYFSALRERQSSFYRRLWQELSEVKVYDTHEHLGPERTLKQPVTPGGPGLLLGCDGFDYAYVHGFTRQPGQYAQWAETVQRQRGTGYVKSLLWAYEDLFGLQPPVTAKYMERLEQHLNEAYADTTADNARVRHVFEDLMHVETVILDVKPIDQHLQMPQPTFQAAAGLPSICTAIRVPTPSAGRPVDPGVVPYWFVQEKLPDKGLSDVRTLDDYLDVIDQLVAWIADSRFLCTKFQLAYERPISFPEPPDDASALRALFNTSVYREDLWNFGDYVMHYYLEQIALKWRTPVQFHTGLARMFDGGSNALNLSHLFEKFPDLQFDLFHGNYPWHMVLAGMLHQIPNVHADLCWLCIISPTAAQQLLTQVIELGDMAGTQPDHEPSYRTAVFGGDCKIAEGCYGALQMAKEVVCRALEDLHDRGFLLEADAVDIAERLLYDNPCRLFGSRPQ